MPPARLHRSLIALALLLSAPAAAQELPATPSERYGPLFRAVQEGRVFDDGKTFADAVPRADDAAILSAYAAERPVGKPALRAFVARWFTLPPGTTVNERPGLRDHIRALWPQLARVTLDVPPGGSALALPEPYVVPGGRFREIYYWDSYFTMLGLKADGQNGLVRAMVDDFASLIERYGHIPNGTRSYYLSRSQPPFFALMTDLAGPQDAATEARWLRAMRAEHDFWMAGADCLGADDACKRVVRMPDGALLNRYRDDRETPRDESWAEDVATARETNRPQAEVWRHLRSGAESGWDFSSRWLDDPGRLATIRTSDFVPVDLNSLLHAGELVIARRCKAAGDGHCANRFQRAADARRAAIGRWLWDTGRGRFADWDRANAAPSPPLSAAIAFPLFTGTASSQQAAATARTLERELLAPGGLRTTNVTSGQQWDAPNGWAPLQWAAIAGLERYGRADLARTIAARWVATANRTYRQTGKLLEKYDVERATAGGGGEYPTQDGFGWTNGVLAAMIERWPQLDPDRDAGADGRLPNPARTR